MIICCGLSAAQEQITLYSAKSVIGILSPDMQHPTYTGIEKPNHLRLTFNDINDETHGLVAPQAADAVRLVKFIRAWDQKAPLLIHCWAGISRSTASAFTALCVLRPEASEIDLAWELREASPSATPNRMITYEVDKVLGREGRMLKAVEAIGRGANAFEGKPFVLRV
ncbi:MAG: tyrosine protein phosphatase [Alphaproteobacteria bacterium]|nr:tyrosine protein phosphatase [Alphaproteobacteria bacterium]